MVRRSTEQLACSLTTSQSHDPVQTTPSVMQRRRKHGHFTTTESDDGHFRLNGEQSTRIVLALARAVAKSPSSALCRVCVEVLDVSGAGITVMSGGHAGPVCVSGGRVAVLEDLQFTTGVGPCQDAYTSGLPVHAPNLDATTSQRWPIFIDQALHSGIGAVFAYPLSTHGARVGVLTLYQDEAGELTADQNFDSLAMAMLLTETVLSMQDTAPPGELAGGLEDVVAYRAEIHQASGMVSIQLEIPVAEALLRIRAHAFAIGSPVGVVAADIVGRRLRLSDDRKEQGEGV